MKNLFLSVAVLAATVSAAFAGETKYPPGTPAAAIAADQAVKAEIAGKPGVEPCYLIDTKTGKCRALLVLDAGGGGGGSSGN